MRTLPKEINYIPKILLLRFSHFFIFSMVAAVERIVIFNDTWAFVSIGVTYGGFVVYDNIIPKNFFFYLFTKEQYFDPPDYLKKQERQHEDSDHS